MCHEFSIIVAMVIIGFDLIPTTTGVATAPRILTQEKDISIITRRINGKGLVGWDLAEDSVEDSVPGSTFIVASHPRASFSGKSTG